MKKSKNFSETWRMKVFGNGAVDAKWTTEIHWQMMGHWPVAGSMKYWEELCKVDGDMKIEALILQE